MKLPVGANLALVLLFVVPSFVFGQKEESAKTKLELLGKNVVTKGDDMAPIMYAEKLYFSSNGKSANHENSNVRVYSTIRNESAHLLPINPNSSNRHMSDVAFNPKADRMYYSLFQKDKFGEIEKGEIWYCDRNYDGTWGRQVRPPKPVNVYGADSMNPAYGFDLFSGKEVLYFASNREGGKGGMDIWMCEIEKGMGAEEDQFGEPINLPFNTAHDELSPFFDTRSQVLYFSSNRWDAIGGKDIYQVGKDYLGKWGEVENMEAPINSKYDEQYFSIHHGSGKAFISSNRFNENCKKKKCQNFDLYEIEMKVEVQIEIRDAIDNTVLPGIAVELVNPLTKEVLQTWLNKPGDEISITVPPKKAYQVIVSKMGYYPVFYNLMAESKNVFSSEKKTLHLQHMRKPRKNLSEMGN